MNQRPTTLRAAAEVALGRQRSPQHAEGPYMVKYLRAANVKDGELDLTDVQSMNFTPLEQGIFALQPGDVLVTEGSGSLNSVGASAVWNNELDETVCFQNTLLRLRPREGVDGRFLMWWSRSAFGSGVFASIASGANIYHLSAERVRALPIQLPPMIEQRRIAGFLDAETGHIDRLRESRIHQIILLKERARRTLDNAFSSCITATPTRLKYLLATKPRYGVLVPSFTEGDGVRFIRVGDLLDLPGRANKLAQITEQLSQQYARTVTRPGDILLSVVGTMGRAALVPPELAGANIARAVASIRSLPGIDPHLIASWMRTPTFLKQAEEATGSDTAQPTLGMEDLANFQLMWPADSHEREELSKLTINIQQEHRLLLVAMESQSSLLAERRQALITAAVTGQFDVTTASGRNVTEGVPS